MTSLLPCPFLSNLTAVILPTHAFSSHFQALVCTSCQGRFSSVLWAGPTSPFCPLCDSIYLLGNKCQPSMCWLLKSLYHKPTCWSWRDGSTVKNSGCFSRGPKFDSQYLHGNSQPSKTTCPKSPVGTTSCRHTYRHKIHIKYIFFNCNGGVER